ncbi:hypothetical protein EDB87DRAFT_1637212, partial [Lactarius vividus]
MVQWACPPPPTLLRRAWGKPLGSILAQAIFLTGALICHHPMALCHQLRPSVVCTTHLMALSYNHPTPKGIKAYATQGGPAWSTEKAGLGPQTE